MQGSQGGYRFTNLEQLTRWLVTTKWGRSVLRDALQSKQCAELVREMVERELETVDAKPVPTYVLVKAYADGWLEVYGERHVRAKVVVLPEMNAEQELLVEDWTNMNLRLPYQRIDYPSNRRATEFVPVRRFGKWVRAVERREFEVSLVNTLTEAGKKLRGVQ